MVRGQIVQEGAKLFLKILAFATIAIGNVAVSAVSQYKWVQEKGFTVEVWRKSFLFIE